MKKIISLLLIILVLLTSTGCWDYTEFEQFSLVIVSCIDYDKDKKETTVTFQQLKASSGNKGGSSNSKSSAAGQSIICSGTGDTFIDAVNKAYEKLSGRGFYGYCQDVIIGEDAAKYIMKDIFKYFQHTPNLPLTANLYITNGKAEDILKSNEILQSTITKNNISEKSSNAAITGITADTRIIDVLSNSSIAGVEPVVARIINKNKKNTNLLDKDAKINELIKVSGISVFKGYKYIGDLNKKESKGFRYITDEKVKDYVSASPKNSESDDKLWYQIKDSKSKIKINLVGEDIDSITINIKVQAELFKNLSYVNNEDIIDLKGKEILEQALNNIIKSDVEAALSKGQKDLKSDIFGFGYAMYKDHPYLWKKEYINKWDEIYPNLKVNINISSKVINTGNYLENDS